MDIRKLAEQSKILEMLCAHLPPDQKEAFLKLADNKIRNYQLLADAMAGKIDVHSPEEPEDVEK